MAGKITEALNPRQLEAVKYCDGPQVVLAGAGSGKTRVLTAKRYWIFAHLLAVRSESFPVSIR